MLGLIFEKINGYRDGSFYTPGFITEYMCRETIRRAVVQKFRDDTGPFADFASDSFADLKNYLGKIYHTEARRAANALVNSITVCDPAVGSGHFLVSALNELIATKSELGILGADAGAVEIRIRAEVANDELVVTDLLNGEAFAYTVRPATPGKSGGSAYDERIQLIQETLFQEKRTLIENCLFGVDLNPNSVKICRLRLWIELLKNAYYRRPDERSEQSRAAAESRIKTQESPIANQTQLETLPNIDINIKQGNSLISRFALHDDLSKALSAADGLTLDDYRQAVRDYHRATGKDDKDRLLELIDKVKHNFQTHIARADPRVKDLAKVRGKLTQLEGLLEVGDLFGAVDAKKIAAELPALRSKVTTLETELAGVRNNAIYQNAFEWRFEFPAVLGAEGEFLGFDVVVGNPPYVPLKDLSSQADYFSHNYTTYTRRGDVYCLFCEKSTRLLSIGGSFGLITSNSWLQTKYGVYLKSFLLENGQIDGIVNFEDLQIFEEATVEVNLLFYSRKNSTDSKFYVSSIDKQSFEISNFAAIALKKRYKIEAKPNEEWAVINERKHDVKTKIEANSISLADSGIRISFGVKTGYNEAFIIEKPLYESFVNSNPLAVEILPQLVRGRDVKKYSIELPDLYLVKVGYKQHMEVEKKYPEIFEYLLSHQERLSKRGQVVNGQHHWAELDNNPSEAYFDLFLQPKLIWGEISDKPKFAYTEKNVFAEATTFFMVGEQLKLKMAILNSRLSEFYFSLISTTTGMGTNRWKKYKIESFPMPISLNGYEESITNLVTQILTQKQLDPQADTSLLEAEIDVLVYRLYGLTYAEVLVVDGEFGMGEGEYENVVV
ncbi:TaqI-like C-terminal specificity domain-containing protein [Neolewinella lacunae]|uniref:site-specific DNA-methyltransferase (adenine-specific) n=1 Tax=Neolewinella lacunae TaxID=1517758 RepID=A0A923PKH3_9BACT|nr:TaqI-like C-terminal specificity domain-containing protein [Neolewinella lacunae]MBC6994356.1 Eco57I restriction-modification methylase domain-containing protein [Neolewinella lacunae]MDN3633286.1 TaqI-like C-terminal specificity domain-containing protein [Neolewinella lacunae]